MFNSLGRIPKTFAHLQAGKTQRQREKDKTKYRSYQQQLDLQSMQTIEPVVRSSRTSNFISYSICFHVIGFSDLVELQVIKIKKPVILCARSTSRSSEQRKKHRSSNERMLKSVYSVVKITRLYDYQTQQTRFWRTSRGVQRLMGFFP